MGDADQLVTASERLVFDLCRRSFLSLWSYANPLRPDGRELCDVLVVFGAHIVVFSVKEIVLKERAEPEVAARRWVREAVDKSIAQLRGARRELAAMDRVIRHDGSPGVDLVAKESRRVHLIAVAAGGKRSVPFTGGGREREVYVHVLEEEALREVLGELDTTAEFLEYIEAKETFPGTIVTEGEENLLAVYIDGGRKLPTELHLVVAQDGYWTELTRRPEFIARKEEDRVSYWWDDLIERLIADHKVNVEGGSTPSEHELVVRTMATESRLARRALSASFLDWLTSKQAGTRSIVSPSGVGYVFGTFPRDWPRERRAAEIMARCLVARSPAGLDASGHRGHRHRGLRSGRVLTRCCLPPQAVVVRRRRTPRRGGTRPVADHASAYLPSMRASTSFPSPLADPRRRGIERRRSGGDVGRRPPCPGPARA